MGEKKSKKLLNNAIERISSNFTEIREKQEPMSFLLKINLEAEKEK